MKAAVYRGYGPPDVVEIAEMPTPEPKDDEVRIRVVASTVSSGDWRARSLQLPKGFGPLGRVAFGFTRPRQPILGTELAGVIDKVGSAVRAFAPGDEVFAFPGGKLGAHAAFVCIREDGPIARRPKNLSWEEAAALSFGGTTALHFLRAARLRAGETILINGASGAVGSAAVQLARHLGAEVTCVCSAANAEIVRRLGAHHVIDHGAEDFTANGVQYDVILDTVGNAPFSRCASSLGTGGRFLLVIGGLSDLLAAPWQSMRSGKKVIGGVAGEKAEDLRELAELAEAGVFRPLIDARFPFDAIVEAHRRVDSGRKRGSVVVMVDDDLASSAIGAAGAMQ